MYTQQQTTVRKPRRFQPRISNLQQRTQNLMYLFTDDIQGKVQLKRYKNIHVGHCVAMTNGLKPGMVQQMITVYGKVYAWVEIHTMIYRTTNTGNTVEVIKHHVVPIEEIVEK